MHIHIYRRLYRIRFATARFHGIQPSSFSRPRKFSASRPARSPAKDAGDRSFNRFPTFVFDIGGGYLGGGAVELLMLVTGRFDRTNLFGSKRSKTEYIAAP